MTQIDQSTRRGRLFVVFIGGLIIFAALTLAGVYLSNQRRMQFEATQGNGTEVTELKDSEKKNDKEVADTNGGRAEEAPQDTATEKEPDQQAAPEETSRPERSREVASTGPSGGGDDGGSEAAEELPTTGPSEQPGELPATGPETFWVVAIVGALVVGYLSFEYRRSRLAFQRAALRRE